MLEAAREIDTVVFDKTGTLTLGRFAVTDVETFGALSEEELIAKAGALEARSEHPIAQAIAAKTRDSGSEVTNYRALPGAGASACMDGEDWLLGRQDLLHLGNRSLSCRAAHRAPAKEGKSVVLFARNETLVGVLGLRDTIRPEAPEAMAALRRRGMRTLLLSGDSANAAKAAAREIGIDEVLAPVRPLGKSDAIRASRQADTWWRWSVTASMTLRP